MDKNLLKKIRTIIERRKKIYYEEFKKAYYLAYSLINNKDIACVYAFKTVREMKIYDRAYDTISKIYVREIFTKKGVRKC